MGKIRVIGLVKLANLVRRQLGGPVSATALDELRRRVAETLESIELGMEDYGVTAESLPAPSRKAYRFLKGLDLEAVEASEAADEEPYLRGTVSLPGLPRQVRWLTDQLSQQPSRERLGELYATLRDRLERVEDLLEREAIRPEHLKETSLGAVGWLRFFGRREWFDTCADAVVRAQRVFRGAMRGSARHPAPVTVAFQAIAGLFRARGTAEGTRISLPVPMVTFTDEALGLLAGRMLRKTGADEAIFERLLAPAYQNALAEFEALRGGDPASPGGTHHDLAAAFDRVNAAYFAGRLTAPRLVWGRTFTMRKFGHYDHVHDTVMVSGSLDAADVPVSAVEFIVYHELLHRELGLRWQNGRRAAHTPEFRRAEKRFPAYEQAQAVLRKLASRRG